VEVDRQGRLAGRGAYLHASNECLETARKRRALERALGIQVPPELWVELRPGARRVVARPELRFRIRPARHNQ
jgi:predicted RNA-binding protein YlxR (DUF448 family)